MLENAWDSLNLALGLDLEPKSLTLGQMILRASIIYVSGIAMVRIAGAQRFAGKHSTFDVILSIILGSTLSRTINGAAPFWGTLGAAFALVIIHRLVAFLNAYSHRFSILLSGRSLVLIREGEIQWHNMHKGNISERDLIASLRSNAHVSRPEQVKIARLERAGDISIIPSDQDDDEADERQPQVIEINVEAGVQTVRVKLE